MKPLTDKGYLAKKAECRLLCFSPLCPLQWCIDRKAAAQKSPLEPAWPLKSTIFKINLNVADMDRGYYADHALTVARHPSETSERMMVRVLAFALHASERLEFGKGISTDDEPALWERDLTGRITEWIEVGLPDER